MTEPSSRFRWWTVVTACVIAEIVPVLLLIVFVVLYSLIRNDDSLSPEEFAPIAGNWVGPIGGFVVTGLRGFWAGRRAGSKPLQHGVAVGIGTALLDIVIATGLTGELPLSGLLVVSNVGRIIAGSVGGLLAGRSQRVG